MPLVPPGAVAERRGSCARARTSLRPAIDKRPGPKPAAIGAPPPRGVGTLCDDRRSGCRPPRGEQRDQQRLGQVTHAAHITAARTVVSSPGTSQDTSDGTTVRSVSLTVSCITVRKVAAGRLSAAQRVRREHDAAARVIGSGNVLYVKVKKSNIKSVARTQASATLDIRGGRRRPGFFFVHGTMPAKTPQIRDGENSRELFSPVAICPA